MQCHIVKTVKLGFDHYRVFKAHSLFAVPVFLGDPQ